MAIDVKASLELALGALNDTMGKMSSTMDAFHKFMQANPRQAPIVRPLAGTVVSDGSTYVYVQLNGPAFGRVWDVRRLAVWKGGGVDPFATVSGVTIIFAVVSGGLQLRGSSAIPQIIDLGLSPGAVPNDATYQAHQFTIRAQQQVVCVLKGTSNNDNYIVTGQAEEYVESMPERIVA